MPHSALISVYRFVSYRILGTAHWSALNVRLSRALTADQKDLRFAPHTTPFHFTPFAEVCNWIIALNAQIPTPSAEAINMKFSAQRRKASCQAMQRLKACSTILASSLIRPISFTWPPSLSFFYHSSLSFSRWPSFLGHLSRSVATILRFIFGHWMQILA